MNDPSQTPSTKPESGSTETRADDPEPSRPKSPFAVPELSERARSRLDATVVVPEVSEEDEERLVHHTASSVLETKSLSDDRFEKWFVLSLFLFGSLVVLASSTNVGMCWDEPYYIDAGRQTLAWFDACRGSGDAPVSGEALAEFWDTTHNEPRGHASVPRLLVALGMGVVDQSKYPLLSIRWPMALCYGLTLVVLYLLVRRSYGRVTAWTSVVAYLFLPRVFGHAHFAVTETPTVLISLLVVYAFLRGLEEKRWAVATGLLFGIALATKVNALFLPCILLPWAFVFHRRESVGNVYAMLFLAPVAMVAVWPWMWDDSLVHFVDYLRWNFGHSQIGVLYFAETYGFDTPPVPWHYPFTMLAFTVPLVTLGLAILGIARTLRTPRHHFLGLLFLWAALLPCCVMMASTSPKYDGVRLFLTAFPFFAILAGIGGGVVVRVAAFFDRPGQRFPRGQTALLVVVLAIVFNGGWALVSVQPNYLSYLNPLAGKPESAFEQFEVTYWGESLNRKALEVINDTLPDGASLTTRAMNINVLRHYQEWGWLKSSIVLLEDRPADYLLLHYRRGFFTDMDRALFDTPDWVITDTQPAPFERVGTFPNEEFPLLGLYRTGPRFETYWRGQVGR